MRKFIFVLMLSNSAVTLAAMNEENKSAVQNLLNTYQVDSSSKFDAQMGSELWRKEFISEKTGDNRSCTTCHTSNLSAKGIHAKTKKSIEPLAPSVNKERLVEIKTIKKWLKRNCKWTIGRECTAQEKGHLLTYIQSQ